MADVVHVRVPNIELPCREGAHGLRHVARGTYDSSAEAQRTRPEARVTGHL